MSNIAQGPWDGSTISCNCTIKEFEPMAKILDVQQGEELLAWTGMTQLAMQLRS